MIEEKVFSLGVQYIIDTIVEETGESLTDKLSRITDDGESFISDISKSSVHRKYDIKERDMVGFYVGLGCVLGQMASFQNNKEKLEFFSMLQNETTKAVVISRLYKEMINDMVAHPIANIATVNTNTIH